jgi:inosine/xanthosine triphosphate pyrophosphatase family protein
MSQPRRFAGETLVIASHNGGKVREIGDLLQAYVAHFPGAGELHLPEPEEPGVTLAWPDGHVETTEGRVDGTLVFPPRGDRGFGYDPIFRPTGRDLTFGEMDQIEKHRISHRADAFRQLVARCFA